MEDQARVLQKAYGIILFFPLFFQILWILPSRNAFFFLSKILWPGLVAKAWDTIYSGNWGRGIQSQVLAGIHSEFQLSLGNLVRSGLKSKKRVGDTANR